MRIIAGKARGRKILGPLNQGRETKTGELVATRPTLDRVKEAIFSIISHKIYEANALDLFAGTGSLGLEAISRGAAHCVFVDYFRETYDILLENIETLGFKDQSRTLFKDYKAALASLKGQVFSLIFIDPPYLNDMIEQSLTDIDAYHLLSEDGVVVAKIDTSQEIFQGSENIKLVDARKYGNTTILFYQKPSEEIDE